MAGTGKVKNLPVKLACFSLLMFGFGFAMVPLYDVFCDLTGLNGKGFNRGKLEKVLSVDSARQIKVEFVTVNPGLMPWDFKPEERSFKVSPGEVHMTTFFAQNTTDKKMVAQAIPSVSPSEAAAYLHKINCFCFNQQPLKAGESADMPLQFSVDPDLPKHISTITLSYALFDITSSIETAFAEPNQDVNRSQAL